MLVGIYGGTFDPVHYGHLAVASEVHDAFELDLVRFVPALKSPLRANPRAAAGHRLRMCELAVEGRAEFEVSGVELDRAGPSYTVDTLRSMRRARPQDELLVIVGSDTLRDLPAWREPDAILALAGIVAVVRSGGAFDIPVELRRKFPAAAARITLHHMPPVDISASAVRTLLAEGRPIEAYVPAAVRDYIVRHGLYRARREADQDPI
jgi:nicotinate-nucleotide adenylyltransferase